MKLQNRANKSIVYGVLTGIVALCAFVGVNENGTGMAEAEARGFVIKDKNKAWLRLTCYPCDSGVETCDC